MADTALGTVQLEAVAQVPEVAAEGVPPPPPPPPPQPVKDTHRAIEKNKDASNLQIRIKEPFKSDFSGLHQRYHQQIIKSIKILKIL